MKIRSYNPTQEASNRFDIPSPWRKHERHVRIYTGNHIHLRRYA